MNIGTTKTTPPPTYDRAPRPVREVGTMEKTQFWDMEDVMEALRAANLRGVPVTRLTGDPPCRSDFSRACS